MKINKFTQLTIYRIRITIFVCPIILEITLTPENIFTHKVNNNNRSFSIYRKKKNWLKNLSKTVIEPIINSFSWLTIISLIRDGRGCKDGIINTERNDIRHVCGKPNTIRKITNYIVHRWIQFILLFRANSPSFFA